MATKAKISDEEALARFESGDLEVVEVRDRASGYLDPIEKAVAARDAADAAVLAAVRDARSRGITWVEIASALGVTYQAAHQRYAHRV